MSLKLLIIADDFTGALDSGAQISKMGVPCGLIMPGGLVPEGCEALVVNTESRHIRPEEAARAVCTAAGIANGALIYKKLDSTLRGNVGAEIAALMRLLKKDAFVAPAFPALGRTTSGGKQLLYGVPVEKTEFGQDRLNPVKCSDIGALLMQGGGAASRNIKPRDTAVALPVSAGETAYVFDAENDEELEYVISCAAKTSPMPILAGSAGLAAHIAPLCGFSRAEAPLLPKGERLLCISGSLKEASQRQIDRAAENGWSVIFLSREELLSGKMSDENTDIAECSRRTVISASHADMSGVGFETICGGLAMAAKDTAQNADGLVIFGGDTASAVWKALGAESLVVLCELEAGVPVSLLRAGGKEYTLITKAGGFGSDELLSLAERMMQK